MRSKKTLPVLLAVSMLTLVLVTACGGGAGEPAEEPVSVGGETLLEERCTQCHGLEQVTSLEQTRAEWEQTVTEMVNRGAELNEDEQSVLVDYLAENYGP